MDVARPRLVRQRASGRRRRPSRPARDARARAAVRRRVVVLSAEVAALVDRHRLEPHPEGGWFRRTWESAAGGPDGRRHASAILYLLEGGATSRWHRVDAEELWVHVDGGPLALRTWTDDASEVTTELLGPDGGAQSLVPAHHWQQAVTSEGWALVTCVVAPEFLDAGFEMAPDGWEPPVA